MVGDLLYKNILYFSLIEWFDKVYVFLDVFGWFKKILKYIKKYVFFDNKNFFRNKLSIVIV